MSADDDKHRGSDLIGSGLSGAGGSTGPDRRQGGLSGEDSEKKRLSGGSLKRNTYSVKRSAERRPYDEDRDKIEYLPPASTSQENESEFRRRRARGDINRTHRRKVYKRNTVVITVLVIVAIIIASFVAIAAFAASVNNDLSGDLPEGTSGSLVAPESDESVYYLLFVGLDRQTGEGDAQADTIMLIRIDPTQDVMSIISIPRELYTSIGGHGKDTIATAYDLGGPSLLIDAVSSFAGVDIAHYAECDLEGVSQIVDELGGVTVDVPKNTSVDGVNISEGTQTLDSAQSLIFLRCQTYEDGDFARIQNQQEFMKALVERLDTATLFVRFRALETFANHGTSDMSVYQFRYLLDVLTRMDKDNLTFGTVPSHTATNSTATTAYVDTDDWNTMQDRFLQGLPPVDEATVAQESETVASVDPARYRVTVKNGSGVSGCAIQAAERLQTAGWNIESTGNTTSFVYTETLVVYNEGFDTVVADRIVADLGVGRVVQNDGSYLFDGDYLVVVGGDWMP